MRMYKSFAFLFVLLAIIVMLQGCNAKTEEIVLLDTFVVFPSMYDGKFIDNGNDDDSMVKYAAVCRSRDDFIEECTKTGVKPGYEIPEYSDECFSKHSIIIIAFRESVSAPSKGACVSVKKITSSANTATIDLQYTSDVVFPLSMPYTIVIEVDAKSAKKINEVVFSRPDFQDSQE